MKPPRSEPSGAKTCTGESALDTWTSLLGSLCVVPYTCRAEDPHRIVYVGDAVTSLTGHHPRDFIENPSFWVDRIHPEDKPTLLQTLSRNPMDPGQHELEYRWQVSDGSYRWFRDVRRPRGEPEGTVSGIWQDVTERKLLQENHATRVRRDAALVRLSEYVVETDDPQAVLEHAVRLVAQVLDTELTKVLELLPDGQALVLRAGVGWNPGLVGEGIVDAGVNSQAGYTLLSSEPVVVGDLRREKRFQGPRILLDHGVISGMSAVIPGKQRPFGVLGAHSGRKRAFTSSDVHFLRAVANIVAAGIRRSIAERERNWLTPNAQKKLKRLDILREITLAVTSTLDLSIVLATLMEKIDALLPYSALLLWLLNRESGELEPAVCRNFDEAAWKGRDFMRSPPLPRAVLRTGAPVYVRNIQLDPRTKDPEFFACGGFVSYLGVPLKTRTEVLGVLSFVTREEYAFDDDEVDFLTVVGSTAAIAIKNSKLYEESEKKSRELSVVNSVLKASSDFLDLDEILDRIVQEITRFFDFALTRVFLYDSSAGEVRLRGGFETRPELWTGARIFTKGEGIVGKVIETGEPLIFEDVKRDSRYRALSSSRLAQEQGFSFLAVFPIKKRDELLGCIMCVGENPRRLTPDEFQMISAMTRQIGIALESARLFEATRSKTRELSALYAVSTLVNQFLTLDELLENIMHAVLRIFGFDAGRIYLFDEHRKELHLLTHTGFPEDQPPANVYLPGEGILGKVFARGEPLLFEDIQTDPKFATMVSKGTAMKAGFRASFGLPVVVKGKIVGVFNGLSKTPHRFQPDVIHLVRSIAEQMGVAVETTNLFQQVKKNSLEMEALIKTNRDIAALLDRDLLLPKIIDEAMRLVNADGGNFLILEDGELVLHSPRHAHDGGPRLSVHESLGGKVMREKRPVAIRDIFTEAEFAGPHREFARRSGYRSFLGVPLIVGERVLGTINLFSKNERVFSQDQINLISFFANQAAVAMQNADMFAEIQKQANELKGLNAQLEEANQTKSEFLSAMSHELRTPLHVIAGYSSLLLDGFGGTTSPQQAEALQTIRHNADVYLQLISSILTWSKVEAKKTTVDLVTLSLEETLNHVHSYAIELNRNARLSLIWRVPENLPVIEADHSKIAAILQNLIGNAFKFTVEGSIEVRASLSQSLGTLEFTVSDTGCGIAEADLGKIFEGFHQLEGAHTGDLRGVGLGLSIVKDYVALLGGGIEVESVPRQGTTFTVTVPCAFGRPAATRSKPAAHLRRG